MFALLILILATCFFIVFGVAGPDWAGILEGTGLPLVPEGTVLQAVGTLGAVVMPHNIFLHSSLVLSRSVDRTSKRKTDEAIFYFTLEAAISLFVSFLINAAIVAVFAFAFFPARRDCPPGKQCTSEIGLSNAGSALASALGSGPAKTIWALGVLAAGQASTLTGTCVHQRPACALRARAPLTRKRARVVSVEHCRYAGQFIMTGFLNLVKLAAWRRALITRSIALVPAVLVAIVSKGFFDELNELLNVVQSIILPFALLPLLKATNSRALMGPYANHGCWKITGWVLAIVVILTNFYLTGLTLVRRRVARLPARVAPRAYAAARAGGLADQLVGLGAGGAAGRRIRALLLLPLQHAAQRLALRQEGAAGRRGAQRQRRSRRGAVVGGGRRRGQGARYTGDVAVQRSRDVAAPGGRAHQHGRPRVACHAQLRCVCHCRRRRARGTAAPMAFAACAGSGHGWTPQQPPQPPTQAAGGVPADTDRWQ